MNQIDPRAKRVISHALVEIRKYRYWPLGIHSAVLLDISQGGFKIEFTGNASTKPGDSLWLTIPLQPLGIYSPKTLTSKVECRWFDPSRCRMGGTFQSLTDTDKLVIEQLIDSIHKRSGL